MLVATVNFAYFFAKVTFPAFVIILLLIAFIVVFTFIWVDLNFSYISFIIKFIFFSLDLDFLLSILPIEEPTKEYSSLFINFVSFVGFIFFPIPSIFSFYPLKDHILSTQSLHQVFAYREQGNL